MRNCWQLFSGRIPSELCDNLVEVMSYTTLQEATTFNSDKNKRNTKIAWVPEELQVHQRLVELAHRANYELNCDIYPITDDVQFARYSAEEESHYDWHHDVEIQSDANNDRKLSVVVQLTDSSEYEGGEFEFSEVPTPNQEYMRAKGSVLVFPSYLVHRVTPVTSGVRHSLVSWIRGPRWR